MDAIRYYFRDTVAEMIVSENCSDKG